LIAAGLVAPRLREPALHVQLAAVDDRGLAGYMLARVLDGEFGSDSRVLRLELLGVRPDVRGHDIGRQLLAALERWAMRHQIHELQTAASWNDHRMIGWLGATGFELAPAHIVGCASDTLAWRPERDDAMRPEYADEAGREIDFSADPPNDYERAARGLAEVR
ncbi:MAG TPA: GNAT family N-acetyltransferase, partial [Burkholderiaceae bacterium]|nr:GNAT family N-acetyltransferase [Burkholderiaceae bacterium]